MSVLRDARTLTAGFARRCFARSICMGDTVIGGAGIVRSPTKFSFARDDFAFVFGAGIPREQQMDNPGIRIDNRAGIPASVRFIVPHDLLRLPSLAGIR